MDATQNADDYWALEKDYQYLFMSNVLNTMFDGFTTYTDYLSTTNVEAVNYITRFKALSDDNKKSTLNDLYVIIENILNSDRINFGNRTFLITYLRRLISFFKSYTVELRDLNFSFYIDGPLEKLKLLDKIIGFSTEWHKSEFLKLICTPQFNNYLIMNKDKLILSSEAIDFLNQIRVNPSYHSFTDTVKRDNLSEIIIKHDALIIEIMLRVSILEFSSENSEKLSYNEYLEASKFHNLIHELLLVNIKEVIVNDYNMSQFVSNYDQILNTGIITRQEKVFLRDSLSVSRV